MYFEKRLRECFSLPFENNIRFDYFRVIELEQEMNESFMANWRNVHAHFLMPTYSNVNTDFQIWTIDLCSENISISQIKRIGSEFFRDGNQSQVLDYRFCYNAIHSF